MKKKIAFLLKVLTSFILVSCSLHKQELTIDIYNANTEERNSSMIIRPYFQSVGSNRFVNIDTIDIRKIDKEHFWLIEDSTLIDFLTDKILYAQFGSELSSNKDSYQWFKDSFFDNNPQFCYLGEMSISPKFNSFVIGVFEKPNPFYTNLIALVNETDKGFVSIAILSEDADVPEMTFFQNCRYNTIEKSLFIEAKQTVLFDGKLNTNTMKKRYRIYDDGRIFKIQ